MEPVACQALLENPGPADKEDPDPASQPPACLDRARHGAMQEDLDSGSQPPACINRARRGTVQEDPDPASQPSAGLGRGRRGAMQDDPDSASQPPACISRARRGTVQEDPDPAFQPPAGLGRARRGAMQEDPSPASHPPAGLGRAWRGAMQKDPSPASQPPVCLDMAQRGVVQGKVSTLYLKLLSLRVGLTGWFFCLKKIQWDMVRWIHVSLELAIDVFFSWVQNALLASMMFLLLAWKVHSGAKQHGWRTLLWSLAAEVQHAWSQSLMRDRCCNLKSFVARVAWAPACCFISVVCYLVRALEAIFAQAVTMAGEEEAADEALPESVSALVLQHEEGEPSGSQ
ncbi:uncharacterized protein LOC132587183 [Heteronotia binoei]|uniref:uncharacterized protein LOC132587183 n=1 Tax=Heteronotia binoei TaxID=13085 RepID=UPI00292D3393|nr:uncharacterized protein LOC132587183 [Heteronotia binoei]